MAGNVQGVAVDPMEVIVSMKEQVADLSQSLAIANAAIRMLTKERDQLRGMVSVPQVEIESRPQEAAE